jgi:hypothetical protein
VTAARAVAGDPLTKFLAFPRNTRWFAEHWLRRGDVHPQEHWVVSERLDPWRQWVSAAEASLREALLAEILPETVPMRAAPAPAITMPTGAAQSPAGEGNGLPWHPSTPELSVTRECAVCSSAFRAQRSTARFCSTRCRMSAHRRVA